jgi:hypothetical protein
MRYGVTFGALLLISPALFVLSHFFGSDEVFRGIGFAMSLIFLLRLVVRTFMNALTIWEKVAFVVFVTTTIILNRFLENQQNSLFWGVFAGMVLFSPAVFQEM